MGKHVPLFIASALFLVVVMVCVSGCMEEPAKNTTPVPGPPILVDYYRTGGIAGVDDHLVIFDNGAVVYSGHNGRGASVLNRSSVDELKDLFRTTDFIRMNESYPAPNPGADYFTYTITYHNHTVRAEDTGVPPLLQPVIQQLNEILAGMGNVTIRS
jgi:hypothetical protein